MKFVEKSPPRLRPGRSGRGRGQLLLFGGLLALLCLLALLAPAIAPYDPYATQTGNLLAPPSRAHLLGTDELGRDIASRLLMGLRPSLAAAFCVVALAAVLGTALGTLGGYLGGPLDGAVRWLITVFQAFPSFLLAVVITGFAGSSWRNACLALAAVYWASPARLARSLTLSILEEPYLKSAQMAGCTRWQLLTRHILPNILPQILVNAMGQTGSVIISMSGLSFLGLGAQRPTCEWGVMLAEAQKLLRRAPQLLLYCSVSLVLLVLICNLFGDALRDRADRRIAQNEGRPAARKRGGGKHKKTEETA